MSAWKSPLLWLGIVLIVAAAAAFAVPYWVDWNGYRADVEEYGRELTGRDVAIDGNIDVRLFPWPVMRLGKVRIANPPQASTPSLMAADAITVRMGLAPLLAGEVDVENVRIEKPVFSFERLPDGRATWQVAPVSGLGSLVGADKVAVSGIEISGGTVELGDRSRAGRARIENVDARLSAPSLNGPWRLSGTMAYKGAPLALSATTGRWRDGQPLTAGIRVSPNNASGLAYVFDGEIGGDGDKAISGSIRVEPARTKDGKADAQSGIRPLVMRARIAASFDRVHLTDIEIAPENAVDVNSYLTGTADIELGEDIAVNAKLSATRLDADTLLGNRGREVIRSRAVLDALAEMFVILPRNVEVRSDLAITTLIVNGEPVEDVDAVFALNRDRLKITRLSGVIGGNGRGSFAGLFVPGDNLPQLSGRVSLEHPSLRDFVRWALPGVNQGIDAVWTGARGRFKGGAELDLTAKSLRLIDIEARLDEASLTGDLEFGGAQPHTVIALKADQFDLDRYVPEGISVFGASQEHTLAGWLVSAMAIGDLDVRLTSPQFTMNGTRIDGLDVDVGATVDKVTIRRLKADAIGGARVEASGAVDFPDNAVAGKVAGSLKAEDVAGLMRLAGLLAPGDPAPPQVAAIGPVDLKISGDARADGDNTAAALDVSGSAAGATFTANGLFDGVIDNWQRADIHVSVDSKLGSSRRLLEAVGLTPQLYGDAPGRLALSATGTMKSGLATTVELELLGASTQFAGVVFDEGKGPEAQGRAALLVQDAAATLDKLGLAAYGEPQAGRVLAAESGLVLKRDSVALNGVNGSYAGATYNGNLKLALADGRVALGGSLSAGRLSLPWIMGLELMPRGSDANLAATRFSPEPSPIDISGLSVNARQLEVVPGLELGESQVDLSADADRFRLQATSTGSQARPTEFALDVTRKGEERLAEGRLAASIDLARALRGEDGSDAMKGRVRIEANFSGSGLSPAGVLSELSGTGHYQVEDGRLMSLDPDGFAAGLVMAETAEDVDALITGQLEAGELVVGGGGGDITIANGVARFQSLELSGEAASGALDASFDMPRGSLRVDAMLSLKQPAGLPRFGIVYRGYPSLLARSYTVDGLKSGLAVMVLKRGMDKLEALEREQRRLQEEERKAREEAERKLKEQQAEQEALRRRQQEFLRQQEELKTQKQKQQQAPQAAPAPEPVPQTQSRAPVPSPRPETIESAPLPPLDAVPPVTVEPQPVVPEAQPLDPFTGSGPIELVPPTTDNASPGIGRQ